MTDLREALQETLQSSGWREVMLPKLQQRLALARARLEDSIDASHEELRALQVEIRLLRELTERTREMFRP